MTNRQSDSVAALRDRNDLLHDEVADLEYAEGCLHYTDFASYENFHELAERHGLKLTAECPENHYRWV